jgi:deoxyribose-phosphate aldolase
MLVKAATGILCREDVEAMVKAGAVRMGTSSTVRINTNDPNRPYASQKNQPPKFD